MAKSRARKLADLIVGAGIDIDGNLTFDGGSVSADLTFGDNDKANFGDASDLQIYHDGSNSYIDDAGAGNLRIRAGNLQLQRLDGTQNYLAANTGAEVALYYAGSKKFETVTGGVLVSGDVRATNWFKGASDTNTLYSDTSNGTLIQTPSNTNDAAGTFKIRDSLGVVHFSLNTNTNVSDFHGGTITSGAITSSGSVNVAGDLNIASVLAHSGDLDTYFQFNTENTARIVVGGSQKFVVNSNGVSINNGTLDMTSNNIVSVGTISSGVISAEGTSGGQNLSYASNFAAADASIQLTIERTTTQTGWGGIGADDTYCFSAWNETPARRFTVTHGGVANAIAGYQVNGTTVIDSSRNLTNIGTVSASGGVEVSASSNLIKHDYNDLGTYVQQVRSYNDRVLILSTKSQDSNNYISFETQDTERMRIDYAGRVGIHTTPSDWYPTEFRALQIGAGATFYGRSQSGDEDKAGISANAYYDTTNTRWEYMATDNASRYDLGGSAHFWYTAPSGTAGDAISWTQSMTLTSDSYLGIGETLPDGPLHVKSTGHGSIFEGTTGDVGIVLHRSDGSGAVDYGYLQFKNSTAVAGQIVVRGEGSASGKMQFFTRDTGGTFAERMVIRHNGYVGIGTTSPAVELDLKRTTNAYPLRVGSSGGEGRAIVFADVADTPTKYNWIAGTQYNIDNGFEITPSTAVGGYTFSSPAVVIRDNGRVGISNTNPNYKLDIISAGDGINLGGSGAFLRWNSGDIQIKNEGSYKMGFYTYNSSDTTLNRRMVIDTDGNVGIGRADPQAKLHLQDTNDVHIQLTDEGNVAARVGANGNAMVFGVDGANGTTERMRLHASGNLSLNPNGALTSIDGVSPAIQIGNSATASAGIAFENQHNGWVTYLTSTDGTYSIWDSTSNNDRLSIDPSGDIGFGTTSPGLSLHIKRSADAGIILENTGAGQTMRIDQNSIRTTTSSQINIFAGNQSNQLYLSGTVARVGINTSTTNADGLTIGTAPNGNCELDLSNTSGTRFRLTSQNNSLLQIYNVNNTSNKLVLGNTSDFGGAFGSTNIQTIGSGYGALTITGSSGGGINMGPNSGTAFGQLYADSSKVRLRALGNEEMWVTSANRREVMYPEGHKSEVTSFGSITGYYHHLGWLDATSSDYTHIKTSVSKNDYAMIKFIYEGYGYSSTNISGSLTVYTYAPQSTPYQPTIVNGGNNNAYGFETCYYSSDNYLVIVLQLIANGYAGGQLWSQSNDQHGNEEVSILAYTGSSNTTGAY